MGGKCDYNNSVEKFEQDSQSGPAPDRRINTMANCAIVGINWGDEGMLQSISAKAVSLLPYRIGKNPPFARGSSARAGGDFFVGST